jgi:two-component system cell cycle sensor histidine kinase/response regulator CckA
MSRPRRKPKRPSPLPPLLAGDGETGRGVPERDAAEQQLRETLSLLSATLESTTDGILVVDRDGHVTSFNRKFAQLWRVPDELLGARDDERLIAYVLEQLADPDGFVAKIRELYGRPEASSFDVLMFTDGRVYERYSQPQMIAGQPVGRVWSFRDVTERRRAERLQQATYRIADAASAARSLQDLLAAVHRIVGELMPATNFYVALYEEEAGIISFPYFVDEVDAAFAPKPWGKGLTEYVIRTGQALLATPEVYRDMERQGEVELIGAPSLDWVGVPLRLGDTTIGVLVVQTYTEGVRYGERERDILQFVSTQVARAIERARADEELRRREARYRLLFESNPEAMFVFDPDTLRFLAVNDAAEARYGWSREEFLRMTLHDIRPPGDQARLDAVLVGTNRAATVSDATHRKKDGTFIDVEILSDWIEFEGRRARLVLAKDVTERRRLEEQLRQSQKMEAIGQLAGGIAHDFNNLLTAILGFCGLLERQVGANVQMRGDVQEIRKAAGRAAELTRKLLAFSRRQMLAPRVLDLNSLVADLDKMLRRVIGEDVELVAELEPTLAAVTADPGQLEQVILNLVVNARDAMPQGGRVTIQTANTTLDHAYADDHAPVVPGHYVLLAVSDTGTGLHPEAKAHLFEPFFTTKEVGKGTGLGLATVYGIVKQSGGYIWVYSEEGQGTTVKIYLPRSDQAAQAPERPPALEGLPTGDETVLVVEDAEAIRSLTLKVLTAQGYSVLVAANGTEALQVALSHSGPLHLVLTDVVMPGMGGRELAQRLSGLRPDLKLLYMSGYTGDAVVHKGMLNDGLPFLPKPFTPEDLAAKVREVLDSTASQMTERMPKNKQ